MGIVINVGGKRMECDDRAHMWQMLADGLGWVDGSKPKPKPPFRPKSNRRKPKPIRR